MRRIQGLCLLFLVLTALHGCGWGGQELYPLVPEDFDLYLHGQIVLTPDALETYQYSVVENDPDLKSYRGLKIGDTPQAIAAAYASVPCVVHPVGKLDMFVDNLAIYLEENATSDYFQYFITYRLIILNGLQIAVEEASSYIVTEKDSYYDCALRYVIKNNRIQDIKLFNYNLYLEERGLKENDGWQIKGGFILAPAV